MLKTVPDAPAEASGLGWTRVAYVAAAVMSLGVGACMWGMPLPLSDNVAILLEVQHMSLREVLVQRFLADNYLRPFFWAQMKVLLELSDGHYFLTFRGLYVLQMVALVFLFARVLRVRTAAGFVAFSMALMVLLGLHTLVTGLTEGPLTAVLCCAIAVNLSFARTSSRIRDAAAVLLLVYGLFSVELGLLVWVCYAAAFLVGCRGISRTGIAMSTAVVALYFALRFVFLPIASAGFPGRATGVWFSMKEPAEAIAAVGGHRAFLYAYNVSAAALTVLFSEPRAGIWVFVHRAALGELAPWLWINVVTSALTTASLAWFVMTRLRAWGRLTLTREDRLVLVFAAILGASAGISLAYTRDVIMSPAGVFYALAAYVAFHHQLTRLSGQRVPLRLVSAAVLMVVSVGWSIRAAGLTYLIRDAAFEIRNDWAMGVERLERAGHAPSDEDGRALVRSMRHHALSRPTPNPWLAQPWAERYFDRLF